MIQWQATASAVARQPFGAAMRGDNMRHGCDGLRNHHDTTRCDKLAAQARHHDRL